MLITVIGTEARRVYHSAHFESDQRHKLKRILQMYRDYIRPLANTTGNDTSIMQEVKERKKVLTSMLLSSDNWLQDMT